MEQRFLTEKLKEKYTFSSYGRPFPDCDLLNIRLLTSTQTSFEQSTLYLTTTGQMPDAGIKESFILFCCGEPIDFTVYEDSPFCVFWFGASVSSAELFNDVMETLTELQQVTTGMHILVNALFSGNGLQYLIDSATQLFGNPIYVTDLQYKYLAMSAGLVPNNTFFNEESATGYISEKGILFIQQNKIDQKVRDSGTAYYCFSPLLNSGMLIDAVLIQGIEVGHIMMIESEHSFREYDPDFFHRFSKLVSMELQKHSSYTNNKGVMYSYFLADLIERPVENIGNIKSRFQLLGYHMKESFYIIAIPPAGHTTTELRMNVILEQMRRIFPGCIYVIYQDTIVLLITKDLDQNLSRHEMSQLEEYLRANQLRAGISNFYQNLTDTPRFYRQAVDSVHLAIKLNSGSPICCYSDYYFYKMLETYEKEDKEIRFLLHPGIMKLNLYDLEHHTDLIKTLTAYLKQPGQPSRISKELHIHKNTLLYRMNKIKEITNCEFSEGIDYMNANLSLMIMQYLHML